MCMTPLETFKIKKMNGNNDDEKKNWMTNSKDVEDFLIYKEGGSVGRIYDEGMYPILHHLLENKQVCSSCARFIIWKRHLKKNAKQWICPLCRP